MTWGLLSKHCGFTEFTHKSLGLINLPLVNRRLDPFNYFVLRSQGDGKWLRMSPSSIAMGPYKLLSFCFAWLLWKDYFNDILIYSRWTWSWCNFPLSFNLNISYGSIFGRNISIMKVIYSCIITHLIVLRINWQWIHCQMTPYRFAVTVRIFHSPWSLTAQEEWLCV